jgi:outer membrane protein, adhesin transport system
MSRVVLSHTIVLICICLLGLLAGGARADSIDVSVLHPVGLLVAQAEAVPSASSAVPMKDKPEEQVPAGVQEKNKTTGYIPAMEYSTLGKERARLLAVMNKSLTVELPPVEFTELPVDGSARERNLSLFDATALALGYSNEVASSAAHLDMSDYLATASLGPLLPHVDLRYNSGREYSNPSALTRLPLNQREPYDTHHRTDSQVFIRQTLMDLPSYFELQRQNLLLKSAEHSLNNIQERVAYDTLVSFMNLIQLRLAVVIAENYEVELKKLLEYVSARAEAGGSTQADMQRVKGRVINARSTVIEARGAYESGLVEFRRLTGIVPSSIAIPENLLPMLPKSFEVAMADAVQNNQELQAALRDMESVVPERRSILGKYAPKFDIELSAISTYNAEGIAGSDPIPNSTVYPEQNDRRAMFVVSWNLLNGGADRMQSKALESKRQEYEYHAKEIQRRLEESLRINFNVLHTVGGRIDGVTQEMESNDLVVAAFNEQLFAANRSLLDVLDAYQRQYNSRTELTRLLISEATAGLQMLRNMGRLQEGIVALH